MMKNLGVQILLAVGAAIFAGLFFGPLCSVFEPAGEIYRMLMAMVIFPYICTALIYGLGSQNPIIGKHLFKKAWFYPIMLWVLVFSTLYLVSLLIPEVVTEAPGRPHQPHVPPKNYLLFFIPQNPLYALANNLVAAIAIFGLIAGVACMHIPQKEPILSLLDRTNTILEKILNWLVWIAPLGVFFRIASSVGTINFERIYHLRFYVLCYIGIALFLTFWILPMILTSLTSFKYKELVREFWSISFVAFAASLTGLALPFINKQVKILIEEKTCISEPLRPVTQTIVPLSYSFMQLGNCILLFFILYAAFYLRYPFTTLEKIWLPFLTLPLSFGTHSGVAEALPLLVQQFQLPQETLAFFEETWVITGHFQVLFSVMSVFSVALLAHFAYFGLLEINWKKVGTHASAAFGLLIVVIVVTKHTLKIEDNYQNLYSKLKIEEVIDDPVAVKVYGKSPVASSKGAALDSPLQRILKSGVLRVGYDPHVVPFSYLNQDGELVGYDIAMAYQLARNLDCRLEFYPIDWPNLGQQLGHNIFDLATSAVMISEQRLLNMEFSEVYLEQYTSLIVPVVKKEVYLDFNDVVAHKGLVIGASGGMNSLAKELFPLGDIVEYDELNDLTKGKIEVVIAPEIIAFIWCLSHPDYTLIDYNHSLGQKFFSYPIKIGAYDWLSFLNNWLDLKREYGFSEKQYNYWIKGQSPRSDEPRWSILRNVLHWID